jgi:hypothetical protein
MCDELSGQLAEWPIAQIGQTVQPTDEQHAALYEVGRVSGNASEQLHGACRADASRTLTGRLATVEKHLEAMLQVANELRPRVDAFYGLLDDERKAKLVIWMNSAGSNDTRQDQAAASYERSALLCESPAAIRFVGWPVERLEFILRATGAQLGAVQAVQAASLKATDSIKLDCPANKALTPTMRIETMRRRLEALLRAVRIILPAVREMYDLLSEEQKTRLDTPG